MESYLLLLYLVILSIYDCREKQVPAVFLYVGIGLTALWLVSGGRNLQEIGTLLLGMLPGLFLLLVAFATKKAGYGDGIVLAVAGAVLGYRQAVLVFCIGLLLVSLVSMLLLLLRKVNGRTKIPFLPFLTAAYVVQWVLII